MCDNDNEAEVGDLVSHKVCHVCGQSFDLVDVDQVFHHDSRPHEPLERAA